MTIDGSAGHPDENDPKPMDPAADAGAAGGATPENPSGPADSGAGSASEAPVGDSTAGDSSAGDSSTGDTPAIDAGAPANDPAPAAPAPQTLAAQLAAGDDDDDFDDAPAVEQKPEATLEWYFLRVQVGREDRICKNMVRRLKQDGLEELVPQIVVPTETIADHRAGKKTVKRRKLYPGYLMVQMKLSDDVWFVLRETPGFGDFVGGQATPTPAKQEDVDKVLATMDASKEQPKVAVQFKKGDRVKIKTGAFENTDATVEEVHPDKGTLDVSVNFFGRPTPLSLGYWEVEPI